MLIHQPNAAAAAAFNDAFKFHMVPNKTFHIFW